MVCASRRVTTRPSSRNLARCCDKADWLRPTVSIKEPTEHSPLCNSHNTMRRCLLAIAFRKASAFSALGRSFSIFMFANLADAHLQSKAFLARNPVGRSGEPGLLDPGDNALCVHGSRLTRSLAPFVKQDQQGNAA